jgi:hypothetical protein
MSPVSGVPVTGQFQIAVAKQQLQSLEQQGRDALELIKSATAPNAAPANVAAGVGAQLNVVA